ncbi:hypothetical protein GCM10023144_10750 [Pigmentiphaga soli]|uniref:HTH marR-type domain-containing protein n=1 Tax=Pigmentiphaga soli TaxID=1007095 RepID=A0ABP8GLZ4_9BURK
MDHLSSQAIELAAQLRPALLRLNRQLRRETPELGVSQLSMMLLSTIKKEPGIGVNDLAARENMRASTMSNHVKQLEAAGFVRRDQILHADKRRVGLSLTPQAERLLEEVRKLRTDWLARRIAALPEAARAALANAVEALQQLGN